MELGIVQIDKNKVIQSFAILCKTKETYFRVGGTPEGWKEREKKSINTIGPVLPMLGNDKDIMMAALKYDGNYLRFASEELKNDKEVVLAAVKNNNEAIQYASETLKQDPDLIKIIHNVEEIPKQENISTHELVKE